MDVDIWFCQNYMVSISIQTFARIVANIILNILLKNQCKRFSNVNIYIHVSIKYFSSPGSVGKVS